MEPETDADLSGVAVAAAVADDAEDVVRLYSWLFEPPGRRPVGWREQDGVEALRRVIRSHTSAVLVAHDSSELVGACTVYLDIDSVRFGQRSWVEDLAVDPRHRSRGIGKLLLDRAKHWARDHGASTAVARIDAHRFYEREQPSWRSVCFGWEL